MKNSTGKKGDGASAENMKQQTNEGLQTWRNEKQAKTLGRGRGAFTQGGGEKNFWEKEVFEKGGRNGKGSSGKENVGHMSPRPGEDARGRRPGMGSFVEGGGAWHGSLRGGGEKSRRQKKKKKRGEKTEIRKEE